MLKIRSLLVASSLILCTASSYSHASIESADHLYKNRGDEKSARAALEEYRHLSQETPSDPKVEWRVAMASYFVGLRLEHDSKARAELFAHGRDAGEAAIRANPNCAECYFWTAINMALYGQEIGPFKMLFSLQTIEDYLERSIEIDPKYASAGAYRLLGLIRQKLPGVLGGSRRKARDNFAHAIEAAPDEPLNYLFLARLLQDEYGDPKTALEMAKRGLAIQSLTPERLESVEAQADLKKWVQAAGP